MYIDAMVWYRHVLQCTDMYQVHTNMYFYLKVCTGMYQVHTIYHWYVLVYTKGPKYVPGTYFSRLVPVCTSMYLVHTGTYSCCTTFVSILKGTSLFILTSSQYVLLTSGFFCAPPPGPAGLPASDLCTCTSFGPHHTKASSSSFTAACRHPWRRRARRSAPPLAALAGPLQRPPPPLAAAGLLHQTPPGAAGLLQGPGPPLP